MENEIKNDTEGSVEESAAATVSAQTESPSAETHTDGSTANGATSEGEGATPDRIGVAAIPYMMDGDKIRPFYKSMFVDDGNGTTALMAAKDHFFGIFAKDDKADYDGVVMCLFNFTRNEIVTDRPTLLLSVADFRNSWLCTREDASKMVTFNVKCTMPKSSAYHFQSMLKRFEECSMRSGGYSQLSFSVNGGGAPSFKFDFSTEFERVEGLPSERIGDKADEMFNTYI